MSAASTSMNADYLDRYQRHFSLAGFGPERQERLSRATVLVIGAGGLGCPALLYLTAAGVGQILILDPDRVETSNLQRQVLFTTDDVGTPKALAAARRLKALNPMVEIYAHPTRFNRENALEVLEHCDLVIDGSDNFPTRYLVNDACVMAKKPFVYGAVQGFEGQASVFNWKGGPTYRCLFPEPPEPGTVPNCAEAGVLGVLPGLVGLVQATEALKILSGIGEPLSGRLWLFDALAMTTHLVALQANPKNQEITELPPEGYGDLCKVERVVPNALNGQSLEINAEELKSALSSKTRLQLIDCRESWERQMGSIEPSVHIPLGGLLRGTAHDELAQLDPAAPTVVYCAVGARSLKAAEILRDRHHFRSVQSLRGGFSHWEH
jgi:molybdopterin/thiamine biosynthesis adenylyltransferase/rhodanese-related sulfurtransferase